MKEGFRQSMAWFHTWVGLLAGWLLFFTFLTGTLGYVNYEIDRWMKPEKPLSLAPLSPKELLPLALSRLTAQAAEAKFWRISFPGGRMNDELEIGWEASPEPGEEFGKFTRETLDPVTGMPIEDDAVRKTGGGDLLYSMHYRLHYMPATTAYIIVGVCAMFMLMAIISGIIIHKKIFKDLFTFRPGKGQRSWLDGHNVLSVTALPFHLMITYSGLIYLMFTYMPFGPEIIYGADNRDLFFEEAFENTRSDSAKVMSMAKTAPLMPMLVKAEAHWGKGNISTININNPGRANAKVTFFPRHSEMITQDGLGFDGVSGQIVEGAGTKYATQTNEVLIGLHEGLFAGPVLRVLYVLSGLGGTAMIGTGLLLWSTKRRAKLAKSGKSHFGVAIVDRLNLGTIVGLPIAIAAYFWANRLIPASMEGRADWEAHAMFITWAAMFVYPVWRPLDRAWAEMLVFAAGAYALLPIVNFFTTDRHLGITIAHGDWVLAGFDLTVFAIGLVFALLGVKSYRKIIVTMPVPLLDIEKGFAVFSTHISNEKDISDV